MSSLSCAGIAYLAHLGIQTWRRADAPADPVVGARGTAIRGLARGVGIAVSNPKGLLFVGAVIPQFVDPSRSLAPQVAILVVTFATLELVATSTVTLGVHALAPLVARPAVTRRLRRGGAIMMLIAAAVLASEALR